MIEVARQVRIERPMAPVRSTPEVVSEPLKLEGGIPVTVYVDIIEIEPPNQTDPPTNVVGLALSPGGPYFIGGISWECSGYALMITFVFVNTFLKITEIMAITPSFWFSDTFALDGTNGQSCCVPSIPGQYHFSVKHEQGNIDPIIVVTPL